MDMCHDVTDTQKLLIRISLQGKRNSSHKDTEWEMPNPVESCKEVGLAAEEVPGRKRIKCVNLLSQRKKVNSFLKNP